MTPEEISALILSYSVAHRCSLRDAAQRFFSLNPNLAHFKPPVRVATLGVARNFILLDRILMELGYGPPSNGRAWMLARVLAYSLIFWKLKPSRAKRAAFKAGISVGDLRRIKGFEIKDTVKGLSGLERLSVLYSMPMWILKELIRAETPMVEKLLEVFNRDPNRWLRIKPTANFAQLKAILEGHGITVERDRDLPDVVRVVSGYDNLHKVDPQTMRLFFVQDKASSLVSHVLEPRGKRVADLTGGAAVKSTHMAWMGAKSVISMDINPKKVFREATLNIRRADAQVRVDPVVGDAKKPPIRTLDAVLIDPPCTDLGRLQFNPEIKMWLKPRDLRTMRGIQLGILRASSNLGRTVVYSVCTLTYTETIGNISLAMDELGLEPVEPQIRLGEKPKGLPKTQRMLPHIHGTQGFFIAKLKPK